MRAFDNGGASWQTDNLVSSLGGSITLSSFLPANPESYTYDLDGNLLTDGRWQYTWDAENRLTSMETSGAAFGVGVPSQRLEFQYDYLGRRVLKRTLSWSNLVSERRFLYDGWNLLEEFDTTSGFSLVAQHVWGIDLGGGLQDAGGVGGLLLTTTVDGGSRVNLIPAFDGNGNVHAMIDAASGSLRAKFEYNAFGETLRASGDLASKVPFRFSTKYTDQESQFLYYGFRYYNPNLGRFLGRDPIEEAGGLHLYAFCGNNPVNGWDFLGMSFTKNSTVDDYIAVYKDADLARYMRGQDEFWNWDRPHFYGSAGDAAGSLFDPVAGSGDPTLYAVNGGGMGSVGDWRNQTIASQPHAYNYQGQTYIVAPSDVAAPADATVVGGRKNGSDWVVAPGGNVVLHPPTIVGTFEGPVASTAVSPTRVVAPDDSAAPNSAPDLTNTHAGGNDGIYSDGSLPGVQGGLSEAGIGYGPSTRLTGTMVSIGYFPVSFTNHTAPILQDVRTGKVLITRAGDTTDGGPKTLKVWPMEFWNEYAKDKPSEVVSVQTVGLVPTPISDLMRYTRTITDAVNSSNISYGNLLGWNSNGYTASYLNWIGLPTPALQRGAWGFSHPLPIRMPAPTRSQ